jgi:hypothetical protein
MRSIATLALAALCSVQAAFLQDAIYRTEQSEASVQRHVHNVSLMLERPVVFGSDRLFLWPIRVPPGAAALTVEGIVTEQRDEETTPVLLIRTGGRVPSTENFDAAEAFLVPLTGNTDEAVAAAKASEAAARKMVRDAETTGNLTEAAEAVELKRTAEASLLASLVGKDKPRAAVRVVLKGHHDTVYAGVWGGRAVYGNTYPQVSHSRDLSVRLAARAEVCSPPTAPVDGRCVRVGSGVFLLPGVSGKHKVEDLSGGIAWTFTLVGAGGRDAAPDTAVQTFAIPRFTSAISITLSRWKDASNTKLRVRLYSDACVPGATSPEDGEGLDRPVTMSTRCETEGWEVAYLAADSAGKVHSTTILLPRAGTWIAVAKLFGPTEDLDPNPVTAALTITTYTVARSAASGAGVLFSDAERTLAAPEGAAGAVKGGSKDNVPGEVSELSRQQRIEAERRWRVAEAAAKAARAAGRAIPGWPFSLDAGTTATQGLTQDFASPSDSAAMFKLTRAGGDVATLSDLQRAAEDKGSDSASPRLRETGAQPQEAEAMSILFGETEEGAAPSDISWSMHVLALPDWSGSGFLTLRLLLNSTMLKPATAAAEHSGCRPLRVFLRRDGMPLASHLDVPGSARLAAEDVAGRGAPVFAPADFTLAPENARVVKNVGAGFTELVWEVERPPPGEWFAAIVRSPAGSDVLCQDVLSTADQEEQAEFTAAQQRQEAMGGARLRGDAGEADVSVVASTSFSDGSSSKKASLLQTKAAARREAAVRARFTSRAVRSGRDLRDAVVLHAQQLPTLKSSRPVSAGASADPAPVMPQVHPLVQVGALGDSNNGASSPQAGSTRTENAASHGTSALLSVEKTLGSELTEVMDLAREYLSELGFGSAPTEEEARRKAASEYNPADNLYAISASLTACSAHCSGQCTLLRSDGVVAGQCVCTNPYRFAGDYCDEQTGSLPFYTFSTFLLVASNAAMIPAVILALRWRLWGEAVVLGGAAAASALYHTCDQFLFCFSSTYHSLQAMDIAGSYLAVVVILMLVAGIPQAVRLAVSVALLAFFLFTLDNPMSLGRAVGLILTVAVAALAILAGAAYSILRNFAQWSKLASLSSSSAGPDHSDFGKDDEQDAFDGDAIAEAFLGDEEPDSGAGKAFASDMVGIDELEAPLMSKPATRFKGGATKPRRGGACLRFFRGPWCCCGLCGCCFCDCCDPANWSFKEFAAARFISWVNDASHGWVSHSLVRRAPRVARAAGLVESTELVYGPSAPDTVAGNESVAYVDRTESVFAPEDDDSRMDESLRARPTAAPERVPSESDEEEPERAPLLTEEATPARSRAVPPLNGAAPTATPTPIRSAQPAPAWCTAKAQKALWGAIEMLLFKAGNFRWKWIYVALTLFFMALLFAVFSTNETYWIVHSLWHISIMAVPAALLLARVDPRAPLLVFDASARRRSGAAL